MDLLFASIYADDGLISCHILCQRLKTDGKSTDSDFGKGQIICGDDYFQKDLKQGV